MNYFCAVSPRRHAKANASSRLEKSSEVHTCAKHGRVYDRNKGRHHYLLCLTQQLGTDFTEDMTPLPVPDSTTTSPGLRFNRNMTMLWSKSCRDGVRERLERLYSGHVLDNSTTFIHDDRKTWCHECCSVTT